MSSTIIHILYWHFSHYLLLDTLKSYHNPSRSCVIPVFTKPDSLPSSKIELAICYRNCHTWSYKSCLCMSCQTKEVNKNSLSVPFFSCQYSIWLCTVRWVYFTFVGPSFIKVSVYLNFSPKCQWAMGKLTRCEDDFACLVWPSRGMFFL